MLPEQVGDVPLVHYPWDLVREDLLATREQARGGERAWLTEFGEYLRKAARRRGYRRGRRTHQPTQLPSAAPKWAVERNFG